MKPGYCGTATPATAAESPQASIPPRVPEFPFLSTPEMLNFFYNGRRWAQRTFEAFFCHEVYPDFDALYRKCREDKENEVIKKRPTPKI